MSRAVMYLPGHLNPDPADVAKWTARCLEHIAQRGHELVAVVLGVPGDDRWEAVEQMLRSGEVEVVVVARQDHLLHLPFEAADQWTSGPDRSQRRTGRVNRPEIINRGTGQPFAVDTGGPQRRTRILPR